MVGRRRAIADERLPALVPRSTKQQEKGGDSIRSVDSIKIREPCSADDQQRQNALVDSVGDWLCPSCGNINYGFRSSCNMRKCGAPRPQNKKLCQIPNETNQIGGIKYVGKISSSQSGTQNKHFFFKKKVITMITYVCSFQWYSKHLVFFLRIRHTTRADVRSQPGSWECTACGNWNYLFREYCNMKRCRAKRPLHSNVQDPVLGRSGPYFPNPLNHSGRLHKHNPVNISHQVNDSA